MSGFRLSKMENRLPVGPGSRGGRWHEPEYRRSYYRAWRAANPEYRERERLRRWRERKGNSADTMLAIPPSFPRPLPLAVAQCVCACGCMEEITNVCGFCRDGECVK